MSNRITIEQVKDIVTDPIGFTDSSYPAFLDNVYVKLSAPTRIRVTLVRTNDFNGDSFKQINRELNKKGWKLSSWSYRKRELHLTLMEI